SIGKEISTMLGGGIYPGMITATVGTALLLAVVGTSYVIVRRRLRYECWYAVHLLAYAGIALAWFHQIPTGNELVLDTVAADYWRALYVATLAIIFGFRVLVPVANAFRYRLRVADVRHEGPGVVSIRMSARRAVAAHHRQGARRPHRRARFDSGRHARHRRGPLRRVHRRGAAQRQTAPHRRRDRRHTGARSRAALER